MKLDSLNNKRPAQRALKESFDMNFNPSKMDKTQTTIMLGKVRKLIKEARSTPEFHKSHRNPDYLKMLFIEQVLTEHLKVAKTKRIVVENESVEKSQVILAAQDLVDTVQEMYEDVNDLVVKELPALVDSIQSQIGVKEGKQYNNQVSGLLSTLEDTLRETQIGLRSALNVLTGEGDEEPFDVDDTDSDIDLDTDTGDKDLDTDNDINLDMDMDDPEDEINARTVGRELR